MTSRPPGRSLAPPQERDDPGGPYLVKIPLPYPELSPNFRALYKAEKYNAITVYRDVVNKRARNVRIVNGLRKPLQIPVGVRICYVVLRRGRRDPDNLLAQLKSAFDGLVDARMLIDDSVQTIVIREIDLVVDKTLREGYVAIELQPGYSPAADPASLAYRLSNGGL